MGVPAPLGVLVGASYPNALVGWLDMGPFSCSPQGLDGVPEGLAGVSAGVPDAAPPYQGSPHCPHPLSRDGEAAAGAGLAELAVHIREGRFQRLAVQAAADDLLPADDEAAGVVPS